MTIPDWRIDDRLIQLSIADKLIDYLEQVREIDSPYCCDVDLRAAIQLTISEPIDNNQMTRLARVLRTPNKLLAKVERVHRPLAAAAIAAFDDFYKNWGNAKEIDDGMQP